MYKSTKFEEKKITTVHAREDLNPYLGTCYKQIGQCYQIFPPKN